jgi:hypothetical protein
MAAGGLAPSAATSRAAQYAGGLNLYVIIVALLAGSGGLLFGYDIGVAFFSCIGLIFTLLAGFDTYPLHKQQQQQQQPRYLFQSIAFWVQSSYNDARCCRYDIGVTGGVTSMAEFQQKFFPDVYERTQQPSEDNNPYW